MQQRLIKMCFNSVDYHELRPDPERRKETKPHLLEEWQDRAEERPFEWAWGLICHHFVLVALVLLCSAAPSGFLFHVSKELVTAGTILWIALPQLLMIIEMNYFNPNKYLLWDKEREEHTHDHMRANLGVHRFFVSQDKNGDVHPNVPSREHPLKFAEKDVENTQLPENITTAIRLGGRVKLDEERDELLGITGFQAMLGMSMQLYQLYAAVLLFCLAEVLAGGDYDSFDESLAYLRTATKTLLCVVLLFYALSVAVPSKKSADAHWNRVNLWLRRSPGSYKIRQKINNSVFGRIDREFMSSSFLNLWLCRCYMSEKRREHIAALPYGSAACVLCRSGLPFLLEIVVFAGYFCASEKGCHLPQRSFTLASVLFVMVGLLTLIALHGWVIREFTRLALCSIFRLQILTEKLRMAINNFDDKKDGETKVKVKDETAVKALVEFLRAWQVTRTFMQRHDIAFFFKSIAAQVGLLIVCMICCVGRVLLHLFEIWAVSHIITLLTYGLVGLWCLCIVFWQACYILQMDETKLEQLRLLRHLELSLKSTISDDDKQAIEIALRVVSYVSEYLSTHDEPPTLLGVRVDPTFINFLKNGVTGTVVAWLISAITKRMDKVA